LTQPQYEPISLAHQVALLIAIEEKLVDRLPVGKVAELRTAIAEWLKIQGGEYGRRINATGDLDTDTRAVLVAAITELSERLTVHAIPRGK
jgi:F-type H+-transporting ATPase subunit alpha